MVEGVATALSRAGVRPATPGEFSRRAFSNGRLDLLRAEAIADLVDAETAAQRRQALAQLEGAVGRTYEEWRGRLVSVLALLEAEIDFPDESLPDRLAHRARPLLTRLLEEMSEALREDRGRQVREGYRIALIGAPNAGKSSLYNALLGKDAAIVSRAPGTTRDVIEARLELEGHAVLLADMAGLRSATDEVEAAGVARARTWGKDAALRILVVDGAAAASFPDPMAAEMAASGDLCVLSKDDLPRSPSIARVERWAAKQGLEQVSANTVTPDGVSRLRALVRSRVVAALGAGAAPAVTRLRHAVLLREASAHLTRADDALGAAPELAAEDVRLAWRALGQVVGAVDNEAVLDEVFATFCIGK